MTDDILFKMFFVKNPGYLKRVVGMILKTPLESITEFTITNSEIPPEEIGDKFCRLDINMLVNGQKVDLEIQVADEGDYKKRSLYYWAREYSSALQSGKEYDELPKVILISIVGFNLFDCEEYHSEFRPLEVTRHFELCDNQIMHYFELKKLPKPTNGDEEIKFWLAFFRAETEEELEQIVKMGVPVMKEAVAAYKSVAVSSEFVEIERLRERTKHNEASALGHARREGAKEAREKMTAEITKRLRSLGMSDDFIQKTLAGG
jgi:predicted transposase/invertase (TIGR01784 family)